jgi:hypothetical protein
MKSFDEDNPNLDKPSWFGWLCVLIFVGICVELWRAAL